MSLDHLPPLRAVLAAHGLHPRRALGQNFLLDLNITDRIARAAGPLTGAHVVEIGPGPGGLTRALLANGAARVVAVERDDRCLPALAAIDQAVPGRLQVVAADALTVSLRDLAPAPRKVVANLPYNIATPLLLGWLRDVAAAEDYTLMLQKEVVDRLAAAPGSRAYGRLGVLTQWLCIVTPCFTLPPQAFTPPPKVDSTVVRLTPRHGDSPDPARFAALERVTAAAFGQRRKTLRRSLATLGPGMPETLLAAAGVRPEQRAETVPVAGFLAMADALRHACR